MDFPENYERLNWCIKTAILDPIRYSAWSSKNYPRIVPLYEDAKLIGLDPKWQDYLDMESREILGVEA